MGLYVFALNDPVNRQDILGLAAVSLSGVASGVVKDPDKSQTLQGTCGDLDISVSIDADPTAGVNIGGGGAGIPSKVVGIVVQFEWRPHLSSAGAPMCCCASVKWEQYFRQTSRLSPGYGSWVPDTGGLIEKYDPQDLPCWGVLIDYPHYGYPYPGSYSHTDEFLTFLRMTNNGGIQTDEAVIQWSYVATRTRSSAPVIVSYDMLAIAL